MNELSLVTKIDVLFYMAIEIENFLTNELPSSTLDFAYNKKSW